MILISTTPTSSRKLLIKLCYMKCRLPWFSNNIMFKNLKRLLFISHRSLIVCVPKSRQSCSRNSEPTCSSSLTDEHHRFQVDELCVAALMKGKRRWRINICHLDRFAWYLHQHDVNISLSAVSDIESSMIARSETLLASWFHRLLQQRRAQRSRNETSAFTKVVSGLDRRR